MISSMTHNTVAFGESPAARRHRAPPPLVPVAGVDPLRRDLPVPGFAADLDVRVHHPLGELPDHRSQHVRARRARAVGRSPSGAELSPGALRRQYLDLAQRIPDAVVVEAGDGLEELRREVTAQIWRACAAAPPAWLRCLHRLRRPWRSGRSAPLKRFPQSVDIRPWVTPVPRGNRWERPGTIIGKDAP
jgi:hypothetical protein